MESPSNKRRRIEGGNPQLEETTYEDHAGENRRGNEEEAIDDSDHTDCGLTEGSSVEISEEQQDTSCRDLSDGSVTVTDIFSCTSQSSKDYLPVQELSGKTFYLPSFSVNEPDSDIEPNTSVSSIEVKESFQMTSASLISLESELLETSDDSSELELAGKNRKKRSNSECQELSSSIEGSHLVLDSEAVENLESSIEGNESGTSVPSPISSCEGNSSVASDYTTDYSDDVSDASDKGSEFSYAMDDKANDALDLSNINDDHCNLHSSTNVTKEEGILKVLNIYHRNKTTKSCLQDILSTICALLPKDHQMPKTIYSLFAYLENLGPQEKEIKHYYCSTCVVYFGCDIILECPVCQSTDSCGVFYEFDIESLVKHFFEKRNLANIIDSMPDIQPSDLNSFSDICDGSVYQDLCKHRKKYDLCLVLSSDGVKLKKSSAKELWLLMVMPVEAPLHVRESFISIVGVWYDSKQPNMNTFLKPFCLKLREIFEKGGVRWTRPTSGEEYCSQVIAPLFVADAPARAKVQNITNFNGKYGCNICEVKAVRAQPVPGKRRVRVYARNFNSPLRECRRMLAQATEASQRGEKVKGVKGPSVMSIIPYIDIAKLLTPEFMHSVLLGVIRQLMYIWFEKPGPWSCKNFEVNICQFLNGIRPPNDFQRLPRDISQLKYWKASEFYNWVLFYSVPALKPYLPEGYFQHYLLLVKSLFTLLQTTVTESEICEAETLLLLFVQDVETLYGDREMSYNMHQILHLGLIVRRWGPLHLTSAFPFENINSLVSKGTHGTINLGKEIVNNIKLANGIHILKIKVENHNCTPHNEGNFRVLGEKVTINLSQEERNLLISMNIIQDIPAYLKAQIGKVVYTSSMYKQLRTADYVVSWFSGESLMYGSIRFFLQSDNELFMFIDKLLINHVNVIYHTETRKVLKNLVPFRRSNKCEIIRFHKGLKLAKEICVGEYICKRPNFHRQVM